MFASKKIILVSNILDHILNYKLDHIIDYMLDQMIIGFMTMALQTSLFLNFLSNMILVLSAEYQTICYDI